MARYEFEEQDGDSELIRAPQGQFVSLDVTMSS